MAELDTVIHQPVRLRIMASLVALPEKQKVDFTYLKDLLNLTDGNLGAHLQKLEEAKYLHMEKTFVARKPKTYLRVTPAGRAAFEKHVEELQRILSPANGAAGPVKRRAGN